MVEQIEKRTYFGGYVVETNHNGVSWHPYPWGFNITEPSGARHVFAGIPNQCETRHAALMRGWWRAKWMRDGTFNERYVPYRRDYTNG
jgi:hypothetical protein